MSGTSLEKIAKIAGVSKNTVSLALRNDHRLPLKTRKHLQTLARRMGYQRNAVIGELMARMRRQETARFQETLALVNANRDPQSFRHHPTIPTYVAGCRARATEMGYSLDIFWLHDPEIRGAAFARILRSRGIRGLALVGMMDENRLPEHFLPVVQKFACVVTGVRTREPELSFCCVDHHALVLQACEQARTLGYDRPGLVLDPVIDRLVEGRFTAGYFIGQQKIPVCHRLKPFYTTKDDVKTREAFYSWLKKDQPDVIFTLYNDVRRWLYEGGIRCPEDIGLIQLERRSKEPEWAGMNQHNDIVGSAAIDLLVGMLHRDEWGIPTHPKAILISSTWSPGSTLKSKKTC